MQQFTACPVIFFTHSTLSAKYFFSLVNQKFKVALDVNQALRECMPTTLKACQ